MFHGKSLASRLVSSALLLFTASLFLAGHWETSTKHLLKEILTFGCLVPLCQINSGCVVSGEVTCNDSSSFGQGSCVSTQRTSKGHHKLVNTPSFVDHGLEIVYQPVSTIQMLAVNHKTKLLVILYAVAFRLALN